MQKQLIRIGHWEGVSYLLLLGVAMPLKYFFQLPEAVKIVGTIHGFLFVGFGLILYFMLLKKQLTFTQSCLIFLLSLIPFGTFFIERWIFKKYSNK